MKAERLITQNKLSLTEYSGNNESRTALIAGRLFFAAPETGYITESFGRKTGTGVSEMEKKENESRKMEKQLVVFPAEILFFDRFWWEISYRI